VRLIKEYTPPTPEDLERLKSKLGYTGNQMAELAGVASNSQWRKYTGGSEPGRVFNVVNDITIHNAHAR
jgi:predicted transcriptional regulator